MSSNVSTSADPLSDPVTPEHFNVWGRIVYAYASAEYGFKLTLAGIMDIWPHEVFILTDGNSAASFRNVAKSIGKLKLSEPELSEFVNLIGEFGSHGPIRNHICHSRWARGTRPGSITPTHINIRSGKAKVLGYSGEEEDYTLDDFEKAAGGLFMLNYRIITFMEQTGITEILAQKAGAGNFEENREAEGEETGSPPAP
jgi:hypothetical protein